MAPPSTNCKNSQLLQIHRDFPRVWLFHIRTTAALLESICKPSNHAGCGNAEKQTLGIGKSVPLCRTRQGQLCRGPSYAELLTPEVGLLLHRWRPDGCRFCELDIISLIMPVEFMNRLVEIGHQDNPPLKPICHSVPRWASLVAQGNDSLLQSTWLSTGVLEGAAIM